MSGIDCFLGWVVIWDGFSWDGQGLLNIIQSPMRVTALFHFIFHLIFVIYVFYYTLTNCTILPMLLTKTIKSTYCRLFFFVINATALGTCTKYYNFRFRCYGRLTQRNTRHLQHTGDVFPWQQLQNHSQGR